MAERCSAAKTSGYWKGYQCGNDGKYEHDGKMYCHAHYAKAVHGEVVDYKPFSDSPMGMAAGGDDEYPAHY